MPKPFRGSLCAHCLRSYLRILAACWTGFGLRHPSFFLYNLVSMPLKLGYHWLSLRLDDVFYPQYRDIEVERPVFIMGHPRSGTTFLHRILTQTEEFVVFKSWEVLHPSLTARAMIGRSRALRGALSARWDPRGLDRFRRTPEDETEAEARRTLAGPPADSLAQEEEVLFIRVLDSQFVAFNRPLGFTRRGYPELVYHDRQPHRAKSVAFLKGCLQRQIYSTGRSQVTAKMNFSVFRLRALLEAFPDARIVYLVRSPLETIPSHLSLHRRILEQNFGLDSLTPEQLAQYQQHRYRYNVDFYRYFQELVDDGAVPEDQLLEIRYEALKDDLGPTLERIRKFADLEFSPELQRRIREQEARQSGFRRDHSVLPLTAFGLTEAQIRSDFDFVFERYGFDGGSPSGVGET